MDIVIELARAGHVSDALSELLHAGKQLIERAVEGELQECLSMYCHVVPRMLGARWYATDISRNAKCLLASVR